MKKSVLLILAILLTNLVSAQFFNYKALITNNGNALANHSVTLRFTILQNGSSGAVVYKETQSATTDANGIVSVNIGEGTVLSGNFTTINWGDYLNFLKVEINTGGGFQNYGTNAFKDVPYAKFADKAGRVDFSDIINIPNGLADGDDVNDADHSTTNELQNLSINGNQLSISNGNTVTLPSSGGASTINDLSDGRTIGYSVFLGGNAGANDDGSNNQNTGVGYLTLNNASTGSANTGLGYSALSAVSTGEHNTAIGYAALFQSTASNNTATGYSALSSNTTGDRNTAYGNNTLLYNSTGTNNTAIGGQSAAHTTTGGYNTAIGFKSLFNNTTGVGNTALGEVAYFLTGTLNNTTCVGDGTGSFSGNSSNHVEIGNTSVTWIGGQVTWSTYSDRRIKTNIKSNVPGLEFINRLRPVTYNLDIHKQNKMVNKGDKSKNKLDWPEKYDIEQMTMTGFIAQEVDQAASEVGYDFSGVQKADDDLGMYSVSYAQFVVPLVKATQELNNKLEDENAKLKVKIKQLEQRLQRIENLINKK